MKIRKIIGVVIFLGSFLLVPTVFADDAGPSMLSWIKANKIVCVSVADPENLPDNYFLLFDYSWNVGEKLGRPWTIIEKGKCYEFGGVHWRFLYPVKIINGDERATLSNYSLYSPEDDIVHFAERGDATTDTFIITDKYGDKKTYDINQNTTAPIGSIPMLFDVNNVFPIKYDISTSNFPASNNDIETFDKISDIHNSLARELESIISECDNRTRIEYQLSISPRNSITEIWKTRDGMSIEHVFRAYGDSSCEIDPLRIIQEIGCQAQFGTFIKKHSEEFTLIDQLSEKYLINNGSLGDVEKKDPNTINRILIFAEQQSIVFDNKYYQNSEVPCSNYYNWLSVDDQPKEEKDPPQNEENIVIPTTLEEPTAEKKASILANSKNPLIKLYFILPILALISFLIILLVRKSRSNVR